MQRSRMLEWMVLWSLYRERKQLQYSGYIKMDNMTWFPDLDKCRW